MRFAVLAGVDLGEEQGDRKTTKRLSLASGLNNTTTVMGTVNFISFLLVARVSIIGWLKSLTHIAKVRAIKNSIDPLLDTAKTNAPRAMLHFK